MKRSGKILLPYSLVRDIWIESINDRIWCSNRYARKMMDLGIEPPQTGRIALNPWADFNISGQFLSETFGLLAPAMPQTAARIGLNSFSASTASSAAPTSFSINATFCTESCKVVIVLLPTLP